MNLKNIPPYVNNTYAVRTRDEWTNIDPFLRQNGFCIVENVLSADRCEELKSMFKTYLREASSGLEIPLDVDNPETWISYKEFYPSNAMMLKHFYLCDSEFMWSVRQDPAIVDLWAHLYDTAPEDMLVSFDGASWNPSPEKDPLRKRAPPKRDFQYHIDDNVIYKENEISRDFDPRYPRQENEKGFRGTVQGIVLLEDIEEGDATLDCLKGAHMYHHEFCTKFGHTVKEPTKDWQKLSNDMVEFYLEKDNVERVRLTAPKGSVFMFLSQTPHNVAQCVFPRNSPKDRFVAYVCYLPRERATEEQLQKKRKIFDQRCGSTHNPVKVSKNAAFPHTWGQKIHEEMQDVVIAAPNITPLGLRLAGF